MAAIASARWKTKVAQKLHRKVQPAPPYSPNINHPGVTPHNTERQKEKPHPPKQVGLAAGLAGVRSTIT